LGLEFAMRFDRFVGLGDRIQVQVIFADPRQEMIRFQEVLATAAEEPAKESVEELSEELVEDSAE
jgi:exoribonuclease II